MSTRDPLTVRVRVAVVIDDKGRYNACGWSGADDPVRWARDGLDRSRGDALVEQVHFIEAEVPLPLPARAQVLQGRVETTPIARRPAPWPAHE
ncbi:MAG: hypothetical protein H6711_17425 [Myxococcales bacterium]|nr:hypothetical protein [Myxococcales bacterium]